MLWTPSQRAALCILLTAILLAMFLRLRLNPAKVDNPPPHLPANSARNNADPTVIGEGEAPAEPHFALPPYISPSLIQPSHLALDPSPVKLNVAIAGQTPSPAFLTAVISNLVASA